MAENNRILCVHQGYELYGSDRVFVQAVQLLREKYPKSYIRVVLPKNGPIVPPLKAQGTDVHFDSLWVMRKKDLLWHITVGWTRLLFRALLAHREMSDFDLIYINTSVVLDYIIASRFVRRKCLIHIHEIPGRLEAPFLRSMLRFSRDAVLYNSQATATAMRVRKEQQAFVVYNGYAGPEDYCQTAHDPQEPLRVLLIGRLSFRKGQDLLIDALARLGSQIVSQVSVKIVGDTFEGGSFGLELREKVRALQLSEMVSFEPFSVDPAHFYKWCDLVVVPSRMPESFGLVAVEAMAHSKPVIAARSGGLAEIVEHGVTGWLFTSGRPADLAACLAEAVSEPTLLRRFGQAAFSRYRERFDQESFGRSFLDVVDKIRARSA